MIDLISREEVLKHQFTFVDESGIGVYYYDVVSVSNIQKINTIPAIPLEKVKQVREKIDEMSKYISTTNVTHYKQLNRDDVLEILDKLIESEE